MKGRVEAVLAQIRSALQTDGGDVELSKREPTLLTLRLTPTIHLHSYISLSPLSRPEAITLLPVFD